MTYFERRISSVEFRATSDSKEKIIEGLAARYNSLSAPLGRSQSSGGARAKDGFRERIMPGAFADVLKTNPDVRMLQDHNPSLILGRTKAGTLSLADSSKGLCFRCVLPDTQTANDLHASIKRGDINQCSFSFALGERGKEKWDEFDEDDFDENGEERAAKTTKSGKKLIVRTLHNIGELYDVSCVTYPAYPNGTSVSARSAEIYVPSPEAQIRANFRHLEEEIEDSSPRQRRKDLLKTILS
jgi:HK97 family phage prohead protease